MLDTSIQVKTDSFDGPLGLLLHLIQREEMDIKKLNITKITEQYLGYLAKMKDLNFDLAGEYLFMASTLLLLKSKKCILEEENKQVAEDLGISITSESELIRRLEDLHKFQALGKKLWDLPKKGHEIFTKPKVDRKSIANSILTPMELDNLSMAMVDLIQRNKRKYTVVKRDRLSIKEKLLFLKSHLKKGNQSSFNELVQADTENEKDITNVIITFISLLELARLNKVSVFQNEESSNIYVDVVDSFDDFDVEIADGFEEEES